VGHSTTSPDGESLASWAAANNLELLHNAKGAASFSSHRWKVGTNSHLGFASVSQDSRLSDRRVLGKFPRSRPRPSLYSVSVKRWNFRKSGRKRFDLLTGKSVVSLPPPDTSNIEKAYQELCESLLFAAEQCVFLSRRKNYVPCCDNQRETLYRSFLRAPMWTDSDKGAASLLSQLDDKKQERWEEAVNSIDASHSNRKAWCAIDKLWKKHLYPHCNIQMRRNRLRSVLACHPFHQVATAALASRWDSRRAHYCSQSLLPATVNANLDKRVH